ncbi:transposase [Mesorhizobium sp. M0040]
MMRLTAAQLSALLEGLDWRRVLASSQRARPRAIRSRFVVGSDRRPSMSVWRCPFTAPLCEPGRDQHRG